MATEKKDFGTDVGRKAFDNEENMKDASTFEKQDLSDNMRELAGREKEPPVDKKEDSDD